jgi:hypothetical protein
VKSVDYSGQLVEISHPDGLEPMLSAYADVGSVSWVVGLGMLVTVTALLLGTRLFVKWIWTGFAAGFTAYILVFIRVKALRNRF